MITFPMSDHVMLVTTTKDISPILLAKKILTTINDQRVKRESPQLCLKNSLTGGITSVLIVVGIVNSSYGFMSSQKCHKLKNGTAHCD